MPSSGCDQLRGTELESVLAPPTASAALPVGFARLATVSGKVAR